MLYAEEEPSERALYFVCKICEYSEPAAEGNEFENCVYKVDMEAKAMQLMVNQDIVDDPTLQKRNILHCMNKTKKCNNKEVICYNQITHEKFDLIYVCTKCRHAWRMREKDPLYDIDIPEEVNK